MSDGQYVTEQFRALQRRSGLSMEALAKAMGYKGASSIQRYFDAGIFKKRFLPMNVADRAADALVGLGEPPIETKEVWSLAGVRQSKDEDGIPGRSVLDPARTEVGSKVEPVDIEKNSNYTLPVFASATGGDDSMEVIPEPVDYIRRTDAVMNARDAFAVNVIGDSMEPWVEQGEYIVVNPNMQPQRGGGVLLVRIDDGNQWHAIVKRLVGWTKDAWQVRQYNPKKDFELKKSDWPKAYPILNRGNR